MSLVASGGMGRVYRAEQMPLGRIVALKILDVRGSAWESSDASVASSVGGMDRAEQRFLREASVCAKLTHPNTVTVFDYGATDENLYYIAMEMLEGRTLQQAIGQDGHFAAERAVRIALQIARSLREAHHMGVIHRDLKPGNIYLVRHDEDPDFVKVLDFGLVKGVSSEAQDITRTGTFVGSPAYVSPEQIRNKDVDFRCDIYSLGVIMYQMLTGSVPFHEPTAMDTILSHLQKPPPPMGEKNALIRVPANIEDIVMRCMAKNPSERYASMDAFQRALQEAANEANLIVFSHSGTVSGEVLRATPIAETEAARPWLQWSLVSLAAAAMAVVGFVFWNGTRGPAVPTESTGTPTTLLLRSDPVGATVSVGERILCAATPCDVVWNRPGEPGAPVTFSFEYPGYPTKPVRVAMSGGTVRVAAALDVRAAVTGLSATPEVAPERALRPAPRALSKPTRAVKTAVASERPDAMKGAYKKARKVSNPAARVPKRKKKSAQYKDNPY